MESKLDVMLKELQAYKNYSFKKVVEDRLDKTLKLYLTNLEESYGRVLSKKTETVVKELSRK